MLAVQITEFGGPEVLQVVDVPAPEPGPDELVIRVARAGLNFADTHQRTNSYVAKATLPLVPGGEVIGTQEDTGDRVAALCWLGGYAQYAVARRDLTFPVPDDVDDATALALLIQGLTAHHILVTSAHLSDGESVVVHSAAGGVGSLTVQLAKALGAGRVIATASSEDKRALALSLGADVAIDGDADGLEERLRAANDDAPIDVVLDQAGGPVFDASLKALAPFGRIVTYGIASREQNTLRTGSLMRNTRAVIGFWLRHCLDNPGELVAPALAALFERARRGELRAISGGTYPLAEAGRAQTDLQERRTQGKLLLDPWA